MNTAPFSRLLVLVPALALAACNGEEGKRAPVCGQIGAICDAADGGTDLEESSDDGTDGGTFADDDRGEDTGGASSDGAGAADGEPSASTGELPGHGDFTAGGEDSSDGASDGGSDDDTTDTAPADPPAGFVKPQPFGDSVLETDLIGVWTLPIGGGTLEYSMALEIADDGRFEWREYDDACVFTQLGSGWIWVEGHQLVMLFDQWVGAAPWPVEAKYGWAAHAPFLLRAGYAPIVGNLGVMAPAAIRKATPWQSRGYARTVGGSTVQDIWVSETELWAIAPDATEADIVVRDRRTLDLTSDSPGTATFNRWWFAQGQIDPETPVSSAVPYSADGGANATIAGAHHVHLGPSMATWAPGDKFVQDGDILCE